MRLFIIALALFAACQQLPAAAPDAAPPADSIDVMSFNIRYGSANDGDNRWELRRELVTGALVAAEPDVLGLQEVLAFQAEEIRTALAEAFGAGTYAFIGVGRDDGATKGEYAPLFVDTRRFDVVVSGTFWFASQPEEVGAVDWGANLPRICTWAELRERETGTRLQVFNAHLDHQSAESRERSCALLRDQVRTLAKGRRAVVMGDFNAEEASTAIRSLTAPASGPALVDTLRSLHPEGALPGTFNGFRDEPPVRRIDYVFVTPDLAVQKAWIDGERVAGRWPSDHTAIGATLVPND